MTALDDLFNEIGLEDRTRTSREIVALAIGWSFRRLIRLQNMTPDILFFSEFIKKLRGTIVVGLIRGTFRSRLRRNRRSRDRRRCVLFTVCWNRQNVGVFKSIVCFRNWLWLE